MLHSLKPLRIAAMPDVVLDVFVSGGMGPAEVSYTQPSVLRQIELQVARYPKYNALATLTSHPPPRTPPSNVVSRIKPRNNFNRTLNNHHHPSMSTVGYAPQLNAKQRGLKDAKEAMRRATARVDLRVLHDKRDCPPQDFSKALKCCLRNRGQGHASALVCVGDLVLEGRGVSRDASVTAQLVPQNRHPRPHPRPTPYQCVVRER